MASPDEGFLHLRKDIFKCITVNSRKIEFKSDENFREKLKASLDVWREEGVRGVWVKLATEHASLIPVSIVLGFEFHHTQPSYLMLKIWLQDDEPDNLPVYSNHCVGAAGFVVNSNNQVLVIQEKYQTKKHWKLPGGIADTGENIGQAACRETFEETGIRCEFRAVIAFRHQHKFRFGCSDLYFVCLLHPLTDTIKKCSHEIEQVAWMNVDDYAIHPDVTDSNRYFAQRYLEQVEQGFFMQPEAVLAYNGVDHHLIYGASNMTNRSENVSSDGCPDPNVSKLNPHSSSTKI